MDLMKGAITSLEDYYFPVEVRPEILYEGNSDYNRAAKYRAIVRQDTDSLISIQPKSYRLVKNEDLIKSLLATLDRTDMRYELDKNHCFVSDERMRLALTFPELQFEDDESKSNIQLYIHNSYNASEGVRIIWGAIRSICTNGMVIGYGIDKIYKRHTQGFNPLIIKQQMDEIYNKIPDINERVKILESMEVDGTLCKGIEEGLGKTIAKECSVEQAEGMMSIWQLYNVLTYYVSHKIQLQYRARYQQQISNIFKF